MYEDWVEEELRICPRYVLEIFSSETRLAVTNGVIRELSDSASQTVARSSGARLATDVDVKWCMEVLGYALTLPFNAEFENTIRNAVKIYCEWLTCVFQDGNRHVPPPLREQPCFYVPEILGHMHGLFVARKENGQDGGSGSISRSDHVTQCLFVLNFIYSMSMKTRLEYRQQVCPELIKFLLSINDLLLSHPVYVDVSLATQSLNVLFLVWLQACFNGCFPCPSYWKTLSKYCRRWRSRAPLIEIWISSCIALTNEMLTHMYGHGYSKLHIAKDDQLFRKGLQPDVVKQTWYRLFCLLKNPALFFARDDQDLFSGDRDSDHRDGSESTMSGPTPSSLPYCYFRYLFGLNCILSGFLGIGVECDVKSKEDIIKSWQEAQMPALSSQPASTHSSTSQTGSFHRMTILGRLPSANISKSKETRGPLTVSKALAPNLTDSDVIGIILKGLSVKSEMNLALPENRPTVDSLLKLFGDWLFRAAFLDEQRILAQDDNVSQQSIGSFSSYDSDTLSKNAAGQTDKKEPSVNGFQAAKAEAIFGLCRLFCSKRSGEQISERSVARFLQALHLVLSQKDPVVLSSLIVSSVNLFRVNLPSCELLAPNVVGCIDWLLSERDQQKCHPSITEPNLRLAFLQLLSATICFPPHFSSILSKNPFNDADQKIIDMNDRLPHVLLTVMKVETDSQNMQILLALLSCYCFSSLLHASPGSATLKLHVITEVANAICELLNSRWLTDFAVSLAILDFFHLIVNLPYELCSSVMPLETIAVAVCHFIENQLARPPPAHSRDLHSTVVAAYGLLEALLVRFPEVSSKKATLTIIWEIIELGETGSKLQTSDAPRKPASQRVYSAADQLLRTMFCRVGAPFQILTPIEDEAYVTSLLKTSEPAARTPAPSDLDFFYISFADSVILAVAETAKLTGNNMQSVVIIRAPHLGPVHFLFDMEQAMSKAAFCAVPHPVGEEFEPLIFKTPSVFPSEVDKVPKCAADLSISEMVADQSVLTFAKELDAYLAKQKKPTPSPQASVFPEIRNRCFGSRVHLARILLHDLGLIDPYDAEPPFHLLDSSDMQFARELTALDCIPHRYVSTVHLFYVRDGQRKVDEILANSVRMGDTSVNFRAFLMDLGLEVCRLQERIWCGNWMTAYQSEKRKATSPAVKLILDERIFDGQSQVIYMSSPFSEIAFIMPSPRTACVSLAEDEDPFNPIPPPRNRSASQDIEGRIKLPARPEGSSASRSSKSLYPQQDFRVLVVWLEKFDDFAHVPVYDLLKYTDIGDRPVSRNPDLLYVVYLTPLENGLYRIKFQSSPAKLGLPGPIVDGVVVCREMLGALVRNTVLSISRRRRLEQEIFFLPVQRRRQKIVEIINRFSKGADFGDKLYSIFTW